MEKTNNSLCPTCLIFGVESTGKPIGEIRPHHTGCDNIISHRIYRLCPKCKTKYRETIK